MTRSSILQVRLEIEKASLLSRLAEIERRLEELGASPPSPGKPSNRKPLKPGERRALRLSSLLRGKVYEPPGWERIDRAIFSLQANSIRPVIPRDGLQIVAEDGTLERPATWDELRECLKRKRPFYNSMPDKKPAWYAKGAKNCQYLDFTDIWVIFENKED